jgi:hypothetical protein
MTLDTNEIRTDKKYGKIDFAIHCRNNTVDDAHHLLLECDLFKDGTDLLLNSSSQAFNLHSVFNPHLIADFSDFRLCNFVTNCMKRIDGLIDRHK